MFSRVGLRRASWSGVAVRWTEKEPPMTRTRTRWIRSAGAGLAAGLMTLTAGCAGGGDDLDFVGFAVPAEANAAVFAEFAESEPGEGLSASESYGASGDQSRAVGNGQPADFVHF